MGSVIEQPGVDRVCAVLPIYCIPILSSLFPLTCQTVVGFTVLPMLSSWRQQAMARLSSGGRGGGDRWGNGQRKGGCESD
jgi:hypothetical protein